MKRIWVPKAMLKIFTTRKTRLDCVHVVPGDARNKLVEEIIDSNLVNYGVVAIYSKDQTMQQRCYELGISFQGLGFKEKHLFRQSISLLCYVLKNNPRILLLHSFYPSLLGIGVALLCPLTKVISVRHHNTVHILSKNSKAVFLDKVISRISLRTIAVSHAVKETMINQGCKPEKVSVIHNGINTELNYHSYEAINHKKLRLVAAGRIDWQKNYETMLNVAAELKARSIDFKLSILGTGNKDYGLLLIEKSRLLGVDDYVEWLGWQSNIENWFVESDIFLHTAIDEACPLVLIEALLVGLPVVSSTAGGSAEVILGFGKGCSAYDVSAYVNEILLTWANIDEIRLDARKQIPQVEQKFGARQMRKAYEATTLELLNDYC